ncbi:peptidase [Pyrococcus sp. NA2]|uniref:peptidase n=1 Tax=Pyrococcus sp. (strain NA2) TaxID=342949 RepID=UPI00064E1C4C
MDKIAFVYMGGNEYKWLFFEVFDRVKRYFKDIDLGVLPVYAGKLKLPPGVVIRVKVNNGYVKMYSFEAVVEALYGKLVEMRNSVNDDSFTKIFGITTLPIGSRKEYFDIYKKYLGIQVSIGNYNVLVLSIRPFYTENRELFVERVFKGVLHEIGHLYGLSHCNNDCVMNPPRDIEDWDRRAPSYCNSCLAELRRKLRPMPRLSHHVYECSHC